jgi:hypothetical protein
MQIAKLITKEFISMIAITKEEYKIFTVSENFAS